MRYNYRLNGKVLSKTNFYKIFNGEMVRYIENKMMDAMDNGSTTQMFSTDLGPLVVVAK